MPVAKSASVTPPEPWASRSAVPVNELEPTQDFRGLAAVFLADDRVGVVLLPGILTLTG
jgi:hypothetical protein